MQIQESLKNESLSIRQAVRRQSIVQIHKPPIIENQRPAKNERYNLDDANQLKQIGIMLNSRLPKADEYCHYPHCEWALIEGKGNSLRNSIEQLEFTARQILSFSGKKVDRAIVIASKINKAEKKIFTKKGHVLYLKKNDKPVLIPSGSHKIAVTLFTPMEIEQQYQDYTPSLDFHFKSQGGS